MRTQKCCYRTLSIVLIVAITAYPGSLVARDNTINVEHKTENIYQVAAVTLTEEGSEKPPTDKATVSKTSPDNNSDDNSLNNKNSDDRQGRAFNYFPVIYYTQETSLALGAGTMQAFQWDENQPSERPNSITALGFYTFKNQVLINAVPDFYFRNGKYNLNFNLSLSDWPATFFGTGEGLDRDDEGEDYASENIVFQTDFLTKIVKSFRIGVRYDLHDYDVKDKEPGGLLDQGIFVGSDGGTISGIGLILDQDNRDSTFWSSRGSYHRFIAMKYSDTLGSDFDFSQYTMDFRQFLSINQKSVLAFQQVLQFSEGEVPFNRLAQLGGSMIMRGIFQGRYRDNNLIAVQGEYRLQFQTRWYVTAFGSVGDVAHEFSDFEFDDLKYTAGGGVRFALDPKNKLNLRFDIGISEFGPASTIILGEAF